MTDFNEYRRKEDERHAKRMAGAKAAICKAFVEQMPDAVRVEIHYQGSGDSGNIEWVVPTDKDGVELKNPPDIDGPAWEIAYGAHPGFENNEGGGGILTVYPHENRIIVSHYDYVIEEVFDANKEI